MEEELRCREMALCRLVVEAALGVAAGLELALELELELPHPATPNAATHPVTAITTVRWRICNCLPVG